MFRRLILGMLVFCTFASGVKGQELRPGTLTIGNYVKDSWYFNWAGKKYIAASDLSRGGISIFVAGNNGQNDASYTFWRNIIGGNHYAPTVVFSSGNTFWFITTEFNFDQSKIKRFTYDMSTGARGTVSDFPNMPLGMTDATIWNANSRWYFSGSRWNAGYLGNKLNWASSTSGPVSGYGSSITLKDQAGREVDRLDGGTKYDWVIEAPAWSWWDHNGAGFNELYWSVGHSDGCYNHVQAIRRGDINYSGTSPWIYVFGNNPGSYYPGGNGDIKFNGGDCGLTTHPDYQANGDIRCTSQAFGVHGIFNLSGW